jgi:hypothetical protein
MVSIAPPGNFADIRETVREEQFLPSADQPERRLAYLLEFQDSFNKCPVTENQRTAFVAARKWTLINKHALRGGLAAGAVLACAPLVVAVPSVQEWQNSTPQHQSYMTAMVTIYAAVIGLINYVFTGTLPDLAAKAALAGEVKVEEAKTIYGTIAQSLFDIYEKDQPLARQIASQLHLPHIARAMEAAALEPDVIEGLSSSLSHAKQAVLDGQVADSAPVLIKLAFRQLSKAGLDRARLPPIAGRFERRVRGNPLLSPIESHGVDGVPAAAASV